MADQKKKSYSFDEISKHNSQESCWLVIGNYNNGGPKVYDVSKYLDDHPGGAEVMLDVAGQDADEFFEDIGHSNDAREELKKYYIGDLFVDEQTKKRMLADAEKAKAAKNASGSTSLMIILVALLAIAYGYYKTQM